jgi:hypothetical protein
VGLGQPSSMSSALGSKTSSATSTTCCSTLPVACRPFPGCV